MSNTLFFHTCHSFSLFFLPDLWLFGPLVFCVFSPLASCDSQSFQQNT